MAGSAGPCRQVCLREQGWRSPGGEHTVGVQMVEQSRVLALGTLDA